MKAVIFRGIGDVALENVPEPKMRQPMQSAIDAYRSFAEHERGWIKVKLELASSLSRAA